MAVMFPVTGPIVSVTRHGDMTEAEYSGTLKRLNINADMIRADNAIVRTTQVISAAVRNPSVLAVKPVPPMPNYGPIRIGPTTIVPKLTNFQGVPSGIYGTSINPFSIRNWFMGSMGVLKILMSNKIVGSILMEMLDMDMFSRIGQKMDSSLKLKFDTQRGEGRGRYVNVRGADGATPGDGDDAYDDPCEWWEIWCRWSLA